MKSARYNTPKVLYSTNVEQDTYLLNSIVKTIEELEIDELEIFVGYASVSGIAEIVDICNKHTINKLYINVGNDILNISHNISNHSLKPLLKVNNISDLSFIENTMKVLKLQLGYQKENVEINVIKPLENDVPFHGKIFHFKKENKIQKVIIGSSNLTLTGLGLTPGSKIYPSEVNVCIDPTIEDEVFADTITNGRNGYITENYDFYQPLMDLFYISERRFFDLSMKLHFDTGDTDQELKIDLEEFKKEPIYNAMDSFQQMAFEVIVNRLEIFNFSMLCFATGYGKTIVYLAVYKFFKLRKNEVVLLAPLNTIKEKQKYNDNTKNPINGGTPFGLSVNGNPFEADFGEYYRNKGQNENSKKYLDFHKQINNAELIIIDEAHNYRNKTQMQEAITNIMLDNVRIFGSTKMLKKILFVTATPINNKIEDIENILSPIVTQFDQLNHERQREIFQKIDKLPNINTEQKNMYHHLLNKKAIDLTFLSRFEKEFILGGIPVNSKEEMEATNRIVKGFPMIDPREINYESHGKIDLAIDSFMNDEKVIFAPYAIGFIKHKIYFSHASSVAALKQTIENMLSNLQSLKEGIANKDPQKMDKIDLKRLFNSYKGKNSEEFSLSDYDKDDEKLSSKASNDEKWVDFLCQIDRPIEKYKELLQIIESVGNEDPKITKLVDIITSEVRQNRKVLVFCDRIKTITVIENKLKNLRKINGSLIKITSTEQERSDKIVEYFNNNRESENCYDVILSTDKLSEGHDFKSLDTVVNYDFHWNPVRTIQRIGRAYRRRDTKDEIVNVYNFKNTFIEQQKYEIVKDKLKAIKVAVPENLVELYFDKGLEKLPEPEKMRRLFEASNWIPEDERNIYRLWFEKETNEEILKGIKKLSEISFCYSKNKKLQEGVYLLYEEDGVYKNIILTESGSGKYLDHMAANIQFLSRETEKMTNVMFSRIEATNQLISKHLDLFSNKKLITWMVVKHD